MNAPPAATAYLNERRKDKPCRTCGKPIIMRRSINTGGWFPADALIVGATAVPLKGYHTCAVTK